MAAATYTFDPAQFAAWLGDYAKIASSFDFTRPLKVIAVLVKADVKERFQTSTDPDGVPWKPLKRQRSGKRHYKGKGKKRRPRGTPKPLLDTGLLQASISANGPEHIEDVTSHSLTVGSSLHYASFHDEGTLHIPQRQFAGFSPKVLTAIDEILAEYVVEQLT